MELNNQQFKNPIILHKTRILRPKEYKALLAGCPKIEYKTMLQALLYTGLRYIELQRFQRNPQWFDGEFIHLPSEASKKKLRTQKERWIRLNNQGRMVIQFFITVKNKVPTYQSWTENLKCWARRGGLEDVGLSVKTTRKTWESWLMFYYPEQMPLITLSQGHTQLISLQHYLNMPFTEADRIEIKNYVEGWVQNPKYYGVR